MASENWVSPWWQAACLPPRWDVAGVVVRALSVWHVFALEQIGNRYLCGGNPDRDDAAGLLLFASMDVRGGRRLIVGPRFRRRAMMRMFRRLRGVEWPTLHEACRDYVSSCLRAPSRWQRSGAKPCSVPYQFHMIRRLCRDYRMTLDAAWDTPYATARCYFDASAEADGDDTIMNAKAQEMEDNWEAYK